LGSKNPDPDLQGVEATLLRHALNCANGSSASSSEVCWACSVALLHVGSSVSTPCFSGGLLPGRSLASSRSGASACSSDAFITGSLFSQCANCSGCKKSGGVPHDSAPRSNCAHSVPTELTTNNGDVCTLSCKSLLTRESPSTGLGSGPNKVEPEAPPADGVPHLKQGSASPTSGEVSPQRVDKPDQQGQDPLC
jgi:hypothetical protein